MKKILKNRIFLVIISVIISSSITAYALTTYSASQITYNKSGTEITLDTALDELYDMKEVDVLSLLSLSAGAADSYGIKENSRTATLTNLEAGTYLVFGNNTISAAGTNATTSSTLSNAGLPTISSTNGECVSLSQIRETAGATNSVASSTYIYHATYNRVWKCTLTATGSISVIGHASVGTNNKHAASAAIQAIKLV